MPVLPPNEREIAHCRAALVKDATIVSCLVVCLLVSASYCSGENKYSGGKHEREAYGSGLLAAATWTIIYVDMLLPVYDPKSDKAKKFAGDAKWQNIGGVLGHCCYFTLQTLFLTAVYHTLCAVAAFTGNAQLQELCYQIGMFVAIDGIGLTILWYALNWCEPKWQAIRRVWEAEGSAFGLVACVVHVPTFFFAFVDMLLVKDRSFILDINPAMTMQVSLF
jgi:hypothetical protein